MRGICRNKLYSTVAIVDDTWHNDTIIDPKARRYYYYYIKSYSKVEHCKCCSSSGIMVAILPWNLVRKTTMVTNRLCKIFEDMFIRCDRIHKRLKAATCSSNMSDTQADRRTDIAQQHGPCLRIASRGNKIIATVLPNIICTGLSLSVISWNFCTDFPGSKHVKELNAL